MNINMKEDLKKLQDIQMSWLGTLDINIETGRKNQIRVHLSEMGYPIVGDKKYGCKDNNLKRLCLHHYEISFINPIDNKLLTIKSEVPDEFDSLFS